MSEQPLEPPLEERLLREARTIAVVARSPRVDRPWHEIAEYLIEAGYRLYLVNPLLDEPLEAAFLALADRYATSDPPPPAHRITQLRGRSATRVRSSP
jgi:hypothetical protein